MRVGKENYINSFEKDIDFEVVEKILYRQSVL
jgi:hypothetical protein